MSIELTRDQERVVIFTSTLWTAIRSKEGPRPSNSESHLLRGLFSVATLDELPLPIGDNRQPGQTVALGSEGEVRFTRPQTSEELEAAYEAEPRLRIYESIDARSGGWTARVTSALGRVAGCMVTCTVYQSAAGERTLGPHRDGWYGGIVQKDGTKDWYLGNDANTRPDGPTLTMYPGDVLLLPEGVMHDVSTPDYSVHMGFAFLTDRPLPLLQGSSR